MSQRKVLESTCGKICGMQQSFAHSLENVLIQDKWIPYPNSKTALAAYKSGAISLILTGRILLHKSLRRSLHFVHIYLGYVLFTPRHGWAQLLSFQRKTSSREFNSDNVCHEARNAKLAARKTFHIHSWCVCMQQQKHQTFYVLSTIM
jgi:hypothetical protein